jgi:hypothetical protein
MERYIGIDAHKESCTMAVMGPTGRRLQELRLETNAKAVKDAVKSVVGQRSSVLGFTSSASRWRNVWS